MGIDDHRVAVSCMERDTAIRTIDVILGIFNDFSRLVVLIQECNKL
jgi:hypothetical protein